MCITYSGRISVPQGIQHGNRIRWVILSLVACVVLPRFFHIIPSMARYTEETTLLKIKCVFGFSLRRLSEIFIIQSKIQ
jgi:hypothetical protein